MTTPTKPSHVVNPAVILVGGCNASVLRSAFFARVGFLQPPLLDGAFHELLGTFRYSSSLRVAHMPSAEYYFRPRTVLLAPIIVEPCMAGQTRLSGFSISCPKLLFVLGLSALRTSFHVTYHTTKVPGCQEPCVRYLDGSPRHYSGLPIWGSHYVKMAASSQ